MQGRAPRGVGTILTMSKTWKIVLAVAVVLVVAVGGGIWWFLRDDAPAKVSLGRRGQVGHDHDGGVGPRPPRSPTSTAPG